MALIDCSYNNLLFILLFALSIYSQMTLIKELGESPHMLIMFIDSVSLLFFVFLEDAFIIFYLKDQYIKEIFLPKLKSKFQFEKITVIQRKKRKQDKLIYSVIVVIVASLLTALNNSFSYFIFFSLLCGLSGSLFSFNILLTWLLLFFLFKLKMFRHHLLAFVILAISLVATIIIKLADFNLILYIFDGVEYIICASLGIIIGISLREVIEKYALDVLYMRQYRLLFLEGVGSLIVNLLVFGIIQFVDCQRSRFGQITLGDFCYNAKTNRLRQEFYALFGFVSINTLYTWLYIAVVIFLNYFRVMINKRHGPTHRYTGDLLGFLLFMIVDMIKTAIENEEQQLYNWKSIVFFVLLTIGCLIYNENILIKACKMAHYTRVEIEKRAIHEASYDITALVDLDVIDEENTSLGVSILPTTDNTK